MLKKHWILLLNLFIFILLLTRNPFSTRTLIPNFEPYPDSIHYIVPARSVAQGGEFAIVREGRPIKPSVPFLYSAVLVPLFIINNDPRVFYFTNILLSLGGLILLYAIIKKILTPARSLTANDHRPTTNDIILFISLFLYVTNYFIYWYPSLAMAENLTLFLFLLNLYVITLPLNKVSIIFAGIIPFCFFLTKYANVPLIATFLLVFGIKLLFDENISNTKKNNKLKTYVLLFGGSVFASLLIMIFTESLPGLDTLVTRFGNFLPQATAKASTTSGGGWFSAQYMSKYLPIYIRAMLGGYSVRFLWDTTPIWPLYIATPGLIGLIFGMFVKKTRLLSSTLILSLFLSIVFMSAFYSIDMRYLYFAIPALLIGFVMFWRLIIGGLDSRLRGNGTKKRRSKLLLIFLLILLFLFYLVTNGIRLKKQIMLNLKYAETPWYYLSVLKLNEYFKNYPKNKKEPVVISAMIPYLIDFYSNGEYSLLPMSGNQEFRNQKQEAWGEFDYSDLIMLYTKILYSGHEIYVHNYGIGNEKPLQEDFQKIKDNFILTKVADGCFDACNIWQLKIKYPLKRKEDMVVK